MLVGRGESWLGSEGSGRCVLTSEARTRGLEIGWRVWREGVGLAGPELVELYCTLRGLQCRFLRVKMVLVADSGEVAVVCVYRGCRLLLYRGVQIYRVLVGQRGGGNSRLRCE